MDIMGEYFWLLCGLLCGVGGSMVARSRLSKGVESGEFSQEELTSFTRGMAFWIFIPCLIIFILQFSLEDATHPEYFLWPSPQKYIAVALEVFIHLSFAWWVLVKNWAQTLSKFGDGILSGPKFIRSPSAFKLYAIILVF